MGALSVRYTDRLVMRFGARRLMFPGFGLIAAGLALFATIPAGGAYLTHIFPVTLLIGTAFGLVLAAIAVAATVLRPERTVATEAQGQVQAQPALELAACAD